MRNSVRLVNGPWRHCPKLYVRRMRYMTPGSIPNHGSTIQGVAEPHASYAVLS